LTALYYTDDCNCNPHRESDQISFRYTTKHEERDSDPSVEIADGTVEIGGDMFLGCAQLADVRIPRSVSRIEQSAFEDCRCLESIHVDEGNPHYASHDGVLYDKGKTALLKFPARNRDNVRNNPGENCYPGFDRCLDCDIYEDCFGGIYIPDSVGELGDCAFEDCPRHGSFLVPKGVTKIGAFAFNNCENLNEIFVPENVRHIGKGAFAGCASLAEITLPDKMTYIGDGAFVGCETLRSVRIPDSVTVIGAVMFLGCRNLERVYLPDSVEYVGECAFAHCPRLKPTIIPKSVREIHASAFMGA
jgi:hypothetical protein